VGQAGALIVGDQYGAESARAVFFNERDNGVKQAGKRCASGHFLQYCEAGLLSELQLFTPVNISPNNVQQPFAPQRHGGQGNLHRKFRTIRLEMHPLNTMATFRKGHGNHFTSFFRRRSSIWLQFR